MLKNSRRLICTSSKNDPEISEMLRGLDLLEFHSAYSHDSAIRLIHKLHLRCHLEKRSYLKIQIIPIARRHQIRLQNRNWSHMLNIATNFLTATHSTVSKWMGRYIISGSSFPCNCSNKIQAKRKARQSKQ